ncbi:MAG: glycosyltransferase, partial [Candidatus Daviesbacteria bacterium]|nr:glycosyltransferase [Candidatus Daviesbacteria bacterium]
WQSYRNVEIIVVDDGSTDNTYGYIKSKFKGKVKYLRNKINKGPNYSMNLGIAASDGEYIHLLDSDSEIINKDMIRNMVKFYSTIPNVGTLGGYFNINSKISQAFVNESSDLVCFDLDEPNALKKCDIVSSCNLFVKKEFVYKYRGFDDFIIGACLEDEFNLILRKNGFVNYFGQSISVTHHKDASERDNLGIKANFVDPQLKIMLRILYGERNYLRYYLKNMGIKAFLRVYIVRFFPAYLIPILAFIKQSFTGFKDKNINKLSLKSKMVYFLFLIRYSIDPFAWNIINFYKIKKYRSVNFIENKL